MVKGTTTSAYVVGGNRALAGLAKVGNGIYGSEVREDTLNPIRDTISPKYQHYYDEYEFATMFAVGEAAAFANNLNQGSQISNKETAKLEQRQGEGQSPQQGQRSQDSLVKNNKNSINKTQTQGNQDYPNNQQGSKGEISSQQGTPVSKTSDINKSGVSSGTVDTTQKVVSTVSNNNKVGDLTFYAEENGYEVYYRTMSLENYESFKKTGKILPTGETTISPTQAFSEGYDGVLIKFKVKKGTTEKLVDIGVRDGSSILADEFPNMPKSRNEWGKIMHDLKKKNNN